MIFELIFTFLVMYLLYKLIFDFIIPVSKVSSQMRDKVNNMHRQQQAQYRKQETINKQQTNKQAGKTSVKPSTEDYIDFEEVK